MSHNQEPNVIIREAWGDEKEVGFRGIEHIDMPEKEMRELIRKYGDTLIALDEIDEEYSGLKWCWHVGKVVSQMDERGEFAKLNRYSDIDIGDDWTLMRYVNFYKLFPDGNYDPRISKSVYFELAVGERLDEAKEAYRNLKKFQDGDGIVSPTVYEVRAWASIDNHDIDSIVATLKREAKGQTSNLDVEKIHRGVRRVLLMEGMEPDRVERDRVADAISKNE